MAIGLDDIPSGFASKEKSAKYHDNDTMDNHDLGIALDLHGRKHVDQQDNADGIYLLQQDTGSSCIVFLVPGKSSADAFRKFLEKVLPHKLIRNEYGHVTPLPQIADDHLPTLQAWLWLQKLEDAGHEQSSVGQPEKHQNMRGLFVQHKSHRMPQESTDNSTAETIFRLASHFTFIVGLLQSHHIFVPRKTPGQACEYPNCQTQINAASSAPLIVNLEPLIHWGTVNLATDISLCRGRAQVFLRNGEKCDDPLWTLAIKRFTSPHPPSYCSDCLAMLMDNRMRIMAYLNGLQPTSFTAVNAQPPHLPDIGGLRHRESSSKENTEGFVSQCGTTEFRNASREEERPVSRDDLSGQTQVAAHNLDGSCDTLPAEPSQTQRLHKTLHSVCEMTGDNKAAAYCESSYNSAGVYSSSVTKALPLVGKSFTPASVMPILNTAPPDHTVKPTWVTVNKLSSTPNCSTDSDIFLKTDDSEHTKELIKRKSNDTESRKISQAITTTNSRPSVTYSRAANREFGREIDANAIVGLKRKSKTMEKGVSMPDQHIKEEAANIRKFLLSTPRTPPSREAETTPEDSTSTQALTSVPPSNLPESSFSESCTSAETEEPVMWDRYLAHVAKQDTTPPHPIKPTSKKKSPPKTKNCKPTTPKETTQPSSGPFFAKRTPTPCPSTISTPTWTAHQSRLPNSSQIICSCRKPALTPNVSIAQCSNLDCAFEWFHYDCLDKSSKISARHGRLVCQHCKNEAVFKNIVTRDIEEMGDVEFSREDVRAAMPGPGGVRGVVNPYGFGVQVQQSHSELCKSEYAQGALGSLGFLGYVGSRPEVMVDAYTNAHAYAHLRERAVEEEVGASDEYKDEEDYVYGEEYGEDGEEEKEGESMDIDDA